MSEQSAAINAKVDQLETHLGKIKTEVTAIKEELASKVGGLTPEETQALANRIDAVLGTAKEVDDLNPDAGAGGETA